MQTAVMLLGRVYVCAAPVASFVPSRVGLLTYRDHEAGALIFGQERSSW